jgi:hypothetical protein
MNLSAKNEKPDKAEVRRQLDAALRMVAKGELLGSQARIISGGVSMSIGEARTFLGLPAGPIPYAV